jgi:DNA-binding transcriptional regulator PaaX
VKDPRLPLTLLPDRWPGVKAEQLAGPAAKLAREALDIISTGE